MALLTECPEDFAKHGIGFTGRIEVDANVTGKDQLSLDVEIIEESKD
jgi:hypothetical protein